MADFARLKNGEDSYPKRSFDGQEDQSYGFNPAYKLQTGTLRGVQSVGYGGVKIDGSNNRIQMEANDIRVTLGDVSNTDDLTGLALYDTVTNKNLVTVGRDTTSDNTTIGLTSYDGTGTRRLLAGTYPDGSVKIKLSQDTYDVATATDDQLIWSSDFNMFKIVKTGTLSIPSIPVANPPGSYFQIETESVDTGIVSDTALSYVAYMDSGTGQSQLPYMAVSADINSIPNSGGILAIYQARTTVTDGTVRFTVTGTNFDVVLPTQPTSVRYYILKETAAA